MKSLRALAITGIIHELAQDNIGIYPESVHGGPNPYEKRSDWQEGWNACAVAYTDLQIKIQHWLDSIPPATKETTENLLLEKKLELSVRTDGVSMYVNCNDTFFWGCADAEEITFEQLPELMQCYIVSPKYGGELWACRQRKMRPQTASYKECYPPEEWALFDASGPPRDDPDGKGRESLCA